jgi:hypothetical protein
MCHHRRHHHHRERAVEPFAAPEPPRGPVRVGDADRERVVELLRGHAAAGRIDADELEERLEQAYAARYAADFDVVLAELPAEPEPRRRPPRARAPYLPAFPIALVALIAVAALSGTWWLLWLIWPLVVVLGPGHRYRHHRHRGVRA